MANRMPEERRQQPRWRVRDRVECWVGVRSRVRLIDISATGVLLGSSAPLPVGTRAHLRSSIGSTFTSDVEIRRVSTSGRHEPGLTLGAVFTGMDAVSQRSLQDFLKKAVE